MPYGSGGRPKMFSGRKFCVVRGEHSCVPVSGTPGGAGAAPCGRRPVPRLGGQASPSAFSPTCMACRSPPSPDDAPGVKCDSGYYRLRRTASMGATLRRAARSHADEWAHIEASALPPRYIARVRVPGVWRGATGTTLAPGRSAPSAPCRPARQPACRNRSHARKLVVRVRATASSCTSFSRRPSRNEFTLSYLGPDSRSRVKLEQSFCNSQNCLVRPVPR